MALSAALFSPVMGKKEAVLYLMSLQMCFQNLFIVPKAKLKKKNLVKDLYHGKPVLPPGELAIN